jgi:hypothetical protein
MSIIGCCQIPDFGKYCSNSEFLVHCPVTMENSRKNVVESSSTSRTLHDIKQTNMLTS